MFESTGSTEVTDVLPASVGYSGRVIQSNLGRQGNFELVVPLGQSLVHYFRDNDSPGVPWHGPFGIVKFRAEAGVPLAVSLLQSNFVKPGNLELVVRLSDKLHFFFRDGAGWHGVGEIIAMVSRSLA